MTILDVLLYSVFLGIGATLVMDVWALFLKTTFGVQPLNWAMVGRWVGNMPDGNFVYNSIIHAPIVKNEKALGWLIHYVAGIVLAASFLLLVGHQWLELPAPQTAIGFGIATVMLPFLVMQPCLGFGVFAKNTPNPMNARMLSILAHTMFGLGLFISALLIA